MEEEKVSVQYALTCLDEKVKALIEAEKMHS